MALLVVPLAVPEGAAGEISDRDRRAVDPHHGHRLERAQHLRRVLDGAEHFPQPVRFHRYTAMTPNATSAPARASTAAIAPQSHGTRPVGTTEPRASAITARQSNPSAITASRPVWPVP